MSTAPTPVEIDYPESDGKPMGETDVHRQWIIRLIDILSYRYREQQVYVSGDLLVYYEEGNPRRFVVPDVFVVKDCDPGPRRIYQTWNEPSPPQVVFEVTSRSSKHQDTIFKPNIYGEIGVSEYFVYDPTSDYLTPPLRGFQRQGDHFQPVEPDAGGWMKSEILDLRLRIEDGAIVLQELRTKAPLLTEGESERRAREEEHRQREEERRQRQEERTAREAAEAEVARLRERLRQTGEDVS